MREYNERAMHWVWVSLTACGLVTLVGIVWTLWLGVV